MSKSIFITGAAQGIGKATAQLFASKGWSVGLYDMNPTTLEQTKMKIGAMATAYVGSVTDNDTLKSALEDFAKKHNNQLDVLVNNAGILKVGELDELPLEAHEAIIDVNLKGVFKTTYFALPFLKDAKNSHIINLSSASAIFGQPEITAYAATKAAVKSMTEGLNMSLEKHGIIVSDLLPIFVKTPMVENNYGSMGVQDPSDVKLTPAMVANVVWKAAHSKKIHWTVGTDTKALYLLSGLFPTSWLKFITKKVIKYE